jgi:hypothetical protein
MKWYLRETKARICSTRKIDKGDIRAQAERCSRAEEVLATHHIHELPKEVLELLDLSPNSSK